MEKAVNIIAFNVPYPPNYGGIIDVFYKIKTLKESGVRVFLHCFEYERAASAELEAYCEKVYYYKRETGFLPNVSLLPYNVNSRRSSRLIDNLRSNSYPILFEGLHTCFFANDNRLEDRIKVCRMTNIEQDYYFHLAKAEKNIIKKTFFAIEALRFRMYQHTLNEMDYILAVSETDKEYLDRHFDKEKVLFIPCFHKNNDVVSIPGQSDFILYHAKLSVSENLQAALFLIDNIFCNLPYKCVIAGMNPPEILYKRASRHQNIHIIANPDEEEMNNLIENAQVNILITYQPTGLKLKLLNSIFAGRHVIVNEMMTAGSGLQGLCRIANTKDEMIKACNKLMATPFTNEIIEERRKFLLSRFSNKTEAEKICSILF